MNEPARPRRPRPVATQSRETIEKIKLRADLFIREESRRLYWAAVEEWAATDNASFPDRGQIAERVQTELEILCWGLGLWAAVDPDDVFPRGR